MQRNNNKICIVLYTKTSVEFRKEVYLTEQNGYAVYLDFNANNGYLLVDRNNNFYEFEVFGDLPYMRTEEEAFYNGFDKFMYFNNVLSIFTAYDKKTTLLNDKMPLGQYAGTDGGITDNDGASCEFAYKN